MPSLLMCSLLFTGCLLVKIMAQSSIQPSVAGVANSLVKGSSPDTKTYAESKTIDIQTEVKVTSATHMPGVNHLLATNLHKEAGLENTTQINENYTDSNITTHNNTDVSDYGNSNHNNNNNNTDINDSNVGVTGMPNESISAHSVNVTTTATKPQSRTTTTVSTTPATTTTTTTTNTRSVATKTTTGTITTTTTTQTPETTTKTISSDETGVLTRVPRRDLGKNPATHSLSPFRTALPTPPVDVRTSKDQFQCYHGNCTGYQCHKAAKIYSTFQKVPCVGAKCQIEILQREDSFFIKLQCLNTAKECMCLSKVPNLQKMCCRTSLCNNHTLRCRASSSSSSSSSASVAMFWQYPNLIRSIALLFSSFYQHY